MRRIINVPARGIGVKALTALIKYKEEHGVSLYKALSQVKNIPMLGSRAQRCIKEFYDVIKDIRSNRNDILPSEVLREILEGTHYLAEFEKAQSFEAQSRLENIKEFIDVITEFEAHTPHNQEVPLLESFLDMISLQTNIDEWDQGEGILSLMTFHCAKGLEFSIVFMVGMEEEIFPHINVLNNAERELEEERRLCYVGITRAKEKVFFSYAQSRRLYGMHMTNMPSRFLGEIPARYLLYSDNTFVEEEETSVYEEDEVIEYK